MKLTSKIRNAATAGLAALTVTISACLDDIKPVDWEFHKPGDQYPQCGVFVAVLYKNPDGSTDAVSKRVREKDLYNITYRGMRNGSPVFEEELVEMNNPDCPPKK